VSALVRSKASAGEKRSGSLALLLRQCQRKAYVREKQTGRRPPTEEDYEAMTKTTLPKIRKATREEQRR
jgi:hypothetical protein